MKRLIIFVALVLVGVGVGYYFGYDHGFERATSQTPSELDVNFREPGILQRNTPYLPKPDIWFFKYDQQGKTGLLVEIAVNSKTQCEFDHRIYTCTTIPSAGRVKAEGHLENNFLNVSKFTELGLNDLDNSMNVPLQKSNTYGLYGTFTLNGYLKVENRVCNPGDMCGETVAYATFVYDKSDNPDIYDILMPTADNAFITASGVGLGCYEKNKARIYSTNDADTGMVENIISGLDLARLLTSSTSKNKIQMKMTAPIHLTGRGAPDCYSSFRNFDVL